MFVPSPSPWDFGRIAVYQVTADVRPEHAGRERPRLPARDGGPAGRVLASGYSIGPD